MVDTEEKNVKRNVLVAVIDTQVDFVMANGRLPVAGAEAIIAPGIRFLAGLDREEVAGVLFTFDTHTGEAYLGSPENLGDEANGIPGFPLHCERGTPGWANVFNYDLVPSGIPVHTLTKGVFDMWAEEARTDDRDDGAGWVNDLAGMGWDATTSVKRDRFFEDLKRTGVDTVRVIGVASDYCVKWAIQGFLDRGFRVEVVGELTAGIQRDIERTVVEDFPGRVLVI